MSLRVLLSREIKIIFLGQYQPNYCFDDGKIRIPFEQSEFKNLATYVGTKVRDCTAHLF